MTENEGSVAVQAMEITEHVKRQYAAPTLIRLNETNIQSGSSVYVAENSNGGAFTNAS